MMSGGHVVWMFGLWTFVIGTLGWLVWLVVFRAARPNRVRAAVERLAERYIEGEIDDDEYWERLGHGCLPLLRGEAQVKTVAARRP